MGTENADLETLIAEARDYGALGKYDEEQLRELVNDLADALEATTRERDEAQATATRVRPGEGTD